jgi:hypothetical protein
VHFPFPPHQTQVLGRAFAGFRNSLVCVLKQTNKCTRPFKSLVQNYANGKNNLILILRDGMKFTMQKIEILIFNNGL